MKKICSWCNKEFVVAGNNKYCCIACSRLATSEKKRESYIKKIKATGGVFEQCLWCGKQYRSSIRRQRPFCSSTCKELERQNREKKKRERYRKQSSQQPCWTCKNYVDGCSWSREFKPVHGWDAKKVKREEGNVGYKILYCPEYEEG